MSDNNKKLEGLTPELVDLVKAILAESRKPTELEKIQLEEKKYEQEKRFALIEQQQGMRESNAAQQKQLSANKRAEQRGCQHEGGRPVHPYGVFIQDDLGGFILCQKCQAVIRQDGARAHYPKNYSGAVIFDSVLFNKCFSQTSDAGIFA